MSIVQSLFLNIDEENINEEDIDKEYKDEENVYAQNINKKNVYENDFWVYDDQYKNNNEKNCIIQPPLMSDETKENEIVKNKIQSSGKEKDLYLLVIACCISANVLLGACIIIYICLDK